MRKIELALLLLLLFALYSCKPESKYSYAIKDFNPKLQPHLVNIVDKGIVMFYDSALHNLATDKEIMQLSKSEHPVLRASVIPEILQRKTFDHYDFLMNNLDDTAIVGVDEGEFGVYYKTVSDYLIATYEWDKKIDMAKTIDVVIREHNYLRAAYSIMLSIDPDEKYYKYIKDMAFRPRKSIGYYGEQMFIPDVDLALYGLAKFKKPGDVSLIKKSLIDHVASLNETSFKIMKEYPDTSYLEVFELYYKYAFYRKITYNQNIYDAEDFIDALVTYKDARAAKILAQILHKKPIISDYMKDVFGLRDRLIYAIWENPCYEFDALRKEIEPEMLEREKDKVAPLSFEIPDIDSSKTKYYWYR